MSALIRFLNIFGWHLLKAKPSRPFITTHKWSLGQGNVFTGVCLSTGREGLSVWCDFLTAPMFLLGGLCLVKCSFWGVSVWETPPGWVPHYGDEQAVHILLECLFVQSLWLLLTGNLALMIRNTSLEIRVISSVTQHQIQRPGKEGQETWNLCGRLWWPSFYDLFVQGWGTWPPWHPLDLLLKPYVVLY